MHRHSPSHPRTPGVIAHQPKVHAFDVIVGDVIERLVRQGRRFFKEGIAYFFAHGGIVRGIRGKFHSLFPVVVFVHSCNVNAVAQQRNAEINGGSAV